MTTKLRQVTVVNELGIYRLGWVPEPACLGRTTAEIVPREMGQDQTEIAHLWTITALHDRFATYEEIINGWNRR